MELKGIWTSKEAAQRILAEREANEPLEETMRARRLGAREIMWIAKQITYDHGPHYVGICRMDLYRTATGHNACRWTEGERIEDEIQTDCHLARNLYAIEQALYELDVRIWKHLGMDRLPRHLQNC